METLRGQVTVKCFLCDKLCTMETLTSTSVSAGSGPPITRTRDERRITRAAASPRQCRRSPAGARRRHHRSPRRLPQSPRVHILAVAQGFIQKAFNRNDPPFGTRKRRERRASAAAWWSSRGRSQTHPVDFLDRPEQLPFPPRKVFTPTIEVDAAITAF